MGFLSPSDAFALNYVTNSCGYLIPANLHEEWGQCVVCRGAANPGWETCYQCGQHQKNRVGNDLVERIGVIAYALDGNQTALNMRAYKDPPANDPERHMIARQMVGYLLYLAFRFHLGCIPAGPVDAVVWVPSSTGRSPHPLHCILLKVWELIGNQVLLPPLEGWVQRLEGELIKTRHLDPSGVVLVAHEPKQHVLVVDDTWTTGAHLQSVGARLRQYGWEHVTGLAVARWVNHGDKQDRQKPLVAELLKENEIPFHDSAVSFCPFLGRDCGYGPNR
ncbi:hypothetical protein [Stomatohabitans albus]|uniref:hypothetical protein n=1 Tax=Stomatohabitans albus TaxID=3110766 RepID=UPI00300C40FB